MIAPHYAKNRDKLKELESKIQELDNVIKTLKDYSVYSTSETVCGIYNGKSLYRKIYIGTINQTNTWATACSNFAPNLEFLLRLDTYITGNVSGNHLPLYCEDSTLRESRISNGNLQYFVKDSNISWLGNAQIVWVAEYTKK